MKTKSQKILYFIITVLSSFDILIHTKTLSKIVVRLIEFILGRKSADENVLVNTICELVDAYLGVAIIIAISFFVFKKRKDIYFVLITIYCFVISMIGINKAIVFHGFMAEFDFTDFILPVQSGYGTLYGTNYPPIAVCIFKFFHNFIANKEDIFYITNCVMYFSILALILSVFLMFFFMYSQRQETINIKQALGFSILMMITGPLIFVFERMNLAIIAFVLTGYYLMGYESENKYQRHLALLALALAANIKYYPAIYGLLLVKKNRWRDSIIVFFEGTVLFFIPYFFNEIFGDNKYNGAKTTNIVANIYNSTKGFSQSVVSYGYSIKSIYIDVCRKINIPGKALDFVYYAMLVIVILLIIICVCFTSQEVYSLVLLAFGCIFIPTVSYYYSFIYLLFPIVYLVRDRCIYNKMFDDVLLVALTFLTAFAYITPSIAPRIPRYVYSVIVLFVLCGKIVLNYIYRKLLQGDLQ